MSVLSDLFDGNINPSVKFIKNGGEYQKRNEQFITSVDELTALLDDKEKQLLETILDNSATLNCLSEKEYFVEGFCIGAKIMQEIMHFESLNFI